MYIAPGSSDLCVSGLPESDQDVFYYVGEPYPAAGLLRSIEASMSAQGWKLLEEDILYPSLGRGWSLDVDKSGLSDQYVRVWLEAWERKGDIVRYVLTYSWPVNGTENTARVEVQVSYIPASIATRIRAYMAARSEKTTDQ